MQHQHLYKILGIVGSSLLLLTIAPQADALSAVWVGRPTSDAAVSYTNGWASVDEEGYGDSDSTYIFGGDDSARFEFQDPPTNMTGTIDSVTICSRNRYYIYFGATCDIDNYTKVEYNGSHATSSSNITGSSYAEDCNNFTTNPDTSAAWQWSEIASMTAGVSDVWNSGICEIRFTLVELQVNYTLPSSNVEYLYPNATTSNELSVTPANNAHWNSVNDPWDSIDTADYITGWQQTYYVRDVFGLTDSSESGTIDQVTLVWNNYGGTLSWTGYGMASSSIEISGTMYASDEYNIEISNSSYYSATWTTDPSDAGAWTWADVDAMEIAWGMITRGASYYNAAFQFFVIVEYTPEGGAVNGDENFWIPGGSCQLKGGTTHLKGG